MVLIPLQHFAIAMSLLEPFTWEKRDERLDGFPLMSSPIWPLGKQPLRVGKILLLLTHPMFSIWDHVDIYPLLFVSSSQAR